MKFQIDSLIFHGKNTVFILKKQEKINQSGFFQHTVYKD